MSEDTQINISTTTEIVNVDVTETLQPVSLECYFAQSSASDTVIDITESIQNIELNVTEIEAQNVEIDFSYPAGPQGPQGTVGPPGSSIWGTISGTLSAQTDLWRYLSAVGTSNFDTQTLIKYLSTTPVVLSSINVKGQILSAGKDLFDIFVTSAGSDSQTLTYIPSSYSLSIIRGNTVNLSSINSTFAANSGKYESVYSTVFNTSADWNTAYNISTAYRTTSASFATNTTLNNVSSLLLPTSVYQSTSGSFATNTALNAASSVLLPTSIYQNASGNWQGTFTTVQTNSANWNTAYTLITSTSGYGILTSSVTTDLSVGGISAAQVLPAGTTFQTFVEQLFLKTYYPTFTAPSISIGSSIGTSIESGTTGLTITVTFLSGSINGKTVGGIWDPNLKQDNRSGILTGGQIFNTQLAKTTYNTIVSTSATRVIVDGSNTFSVRADHEQGPQPKDSKGNNFSTSLPASSVPGSITVTGFRRAFYGADTLTTKPSSSDQVRSLPGSTNNPTNGTVFTISVPIGTIRVVFAYPATLQNVTSVWDLGNYQPYTSSFGSPETFSVSGANNFSPISYKVYTYFPSIPFGNAITLTVTI